VSRSMHVLCRANPKALIDAAKKRRDAPVPEAKAAEPVVEEIAAEAAENAVPIEAAEVSTETEAAAMPEAAGDEEAITKYNIAKERAQKLLKAMGAR